MRLRVRQKEQMRAVLGIDAAWTLTQPSGVAVAAELHDGWHLIAAAASYQRFQALVMIATQQRNVRRVHYPTHLRYLPPLLRFAAARSTSSLLICL